MRQTLVVTLIGNDRPGIVARLAALAADAGANWQESRMARLAGKFAGIVCLEVPAESIAALEAELELLDAEGLRLTIEHGQAQAEPRSFALELVGLDRPGIVRDISAVLARHRISIDELETDIEQAAMSGELLFRAQARLLLPDEAALAALRADLEALADELMVDLAVDTDSPHD